MIRSIGDSSGSPLSQDSINDRFARTIFTDIATARGTDDAVKWWLLGRSG